MGILDDLKHKVEALGEKAREGLEDARDKAGDLLDDAKDKAGDVVDDVRERLGQDDEHERDQKGDRAPLHESEDIGPDSSSTDAVQPGYVTGEDAEGVDGSASDDGSDSDDLVDADTDPDVGAGADDDGADEVEDDGAATTETDAPAETEATASAAVTGTGSAGTDDAPLEPVAKDVDPYDEPLSESIGSELSDADREALAGVVDDDRTDREA